MKNPFFFASILLWDFVFVCISQKLFAFSLGFCLIWLCSCFGFVCFACVVFFVVFLFLLGYFSWVLVLKSRLEFLGFLLFLNWRSVCICVYIYIFFVFLVFDFGLECLWDVGFFMGSGLVVEVRTWADALIEFLLALDIGYPNPD